MATRTPKKSQWHLTDEQIKLVKQKNKGYHLYFASLLKYYEHYQRFFESPTELKYHAIKIIANQLKITTVSLKISLPIRTLERFRAEIREHFNSSGISRENEELIKQWLLTQIFPKQDMNHIQLFNTVISYMQKEKIERISDGYIRRIISSAKQQYESLMFQRIYDSLNSETKGYLDGLMINENQTSRFALMKRWPRGLSLETILGEADKLRFFRLLALPTYLEEIPNKQLLRHYRNISTKYPSAIKLMPETHKYALLAIFAVVRTRQLTDNLVELLIRITHKVVTKGENKLKHELSQVFEIKGNCPGSSVMENDNIAATMMKKCFNASLTSSRYL